MTEEEEPAMVLRSNKQLAKTTAGRKRAIEEVQEEELPTRVLRQRTRSAGTAGTGTPGQRGQRGR